MHKINEENIKKHLIDYGWTDESYINNEIELICYKSHNKRYSLLKRPLCKEDNENIHINPARKPHPSGWGGIADFIFFVKLLFYFSLRKDI